MALCLALATAARACSESSTNEAAGTGGLSGGSTGAAGSGTSTSAEAATSGGVSTQVRLVWLGVDRAFQKMAQELEAPLKSALGW